MRILGIDPGSISTGLIYVTDHREYFDAKRSENCHRL